MQSPDQVLRIYRAMLDAFGDQWRDVPVPSKGAWCDEIQRVATVLARPGTEWSDWIEAAVKSIQYSFGGDPLPDIPRVAPVAP